MKGGMNSRKNAGTGDCTGESGDHTAWHERTALHFGTHKAGLVTALDELEEL